ncbi:MAG: hypothetical protein WBV78_07535 [Roseobacter sp.]
MARKPLPVFLERNSYRKRRLMDALRLLALFGAVLWMIPTLWPNASDPMAQPIATSTALFYVFGVWIVLIGLSALFVHRQRMPENGRREADKNP